MTSLRILFFAVVFCALQTGIAFSQEVLTLEQSIKMALENSLLLDQAETSIQIATLNQEQAIHNRYPSVSGNSGLNFNFGRTIDPTSNDFINQTFISNNYSLNSGILVYGGRRINNSIKQSKVDQKAAQEDYQQNQADIALQVATIYLNGLFAKENIELSKKQLTLTQSQLDNINKLINAGVRPKNESLDLEAQIASNEQNMVLAESSLQSALLQLKQILRMNPQTEIELSAPKEPSELMNIDMMTFEQAYKEALQNQPAVRAAKLRELSAGVGIEIAESAFYPTLTLGGSLNTAYSNRGINILGENVFRITQDAFIDNEPVLFGIDQAVPIVEDASWIDQFGDNLSFGFGLNLNVTIYNNKTGKINKQRAEIGLASTQIATEQIKQAIQTQVLQALTDAKNAKLSMGAAAKTMQARKAAMDNATKQYEAGAINSFDWSNVQSQYDLASVNYLQEKYNYIFRTIILEYYLGKTIN